MCSVVDVVFFLLLYLSRIIVNALYNIDSVINVHHYVAYNSHCAITIKHESNTDNHTKSLL